MTDKSVTLALLTEYERTADLLCSGAVVSPEMLARYHGTTGVLLARVVQSLWSQAQLEERIDSSLRRHVESCPYQSHPPPKSPNSFRDVLLEHARLLIVCLTLVLISAIALGRVQEIGAAIAQLSHSTR